MGPQPRSDLAETASQQLDVEHVGPVALLFDAQQVEQQGGKPSSVEHVGDEPVAGAVAAATAAMGEYDRPDGLLGNRQVTAQPYRTGQHVDLLVAYRRVVGLFRCCCCDDGRMPMLQACEHLVVGGLGEIGVELSDAVERLRSVHADECVGDTCEPAGPIRWCHRDG